MSNTTNKEEHILHSMLRKHGVMEYDLRIISVIEEYAALQLSAHSKDKDEWVRVEEQYPPTGKLALVYMADGTQTIMFVDVIGAKWFTHWQPLPKPPIK